MERDYCMSVAVRAGDLVFIGGLTAVDLDGNELHHDDAAAQIRTIYEQMGRVLAAHGGTAAEVVSETIYYSCSGEEYTKRLFPHRKAFYQNCDGPSVAGVQVAGFISPAIQVEVTCVAYIPLHGSDNLIDHASPL
ncbi:MULTISPECIES: RidA family protein [Novosphingobium]|nr:RidA family protein [Novosphingobium guangzhouense]